MLTQNSIAGNTMHDNINVNQLVVVIPHMMKVVIFVISAFNEYISANTHSAHLVFNTKSLNLDQFHHLCIWLPKCSRHKAQSFS